MGTAAAHNLTPEDLLSVVDRMETPQLKRFVRQILARTARRLAPLLDRQESELMEKINEGLPDETEDRYRELIAARQAETLTSAEMAELQAITEKAETLQAERMKHLVALAQLRDVPLTELMTELGIEPRPIE